MKSIHTRAIRLLDGFFIPFFEEPIKKEIHGLTDMEKVLTIMKRSIKSHLQER
jgi:hypothetical protein